MRTRFTVAVTSTVAATIAVVLLLAGCGTSDSTSAGSDSDSTSAGSGPFDGDWVLQAGLIDDVPLTPVVGYPITLEIDGDRLSGNAGCNGFGGAFAVDDGEPRIADLAITEMACVDRAAMETESTFVGGLLRATTIEVLDEDLVLGGGGVSLTFAPVAPVADSPLYETAWMLDTLLDGDTASSTFAGAEPASLVLGGDGRFTASTGCRDLAGDHSLAEGRLVLDFEVEDSTCDGDAGRQDEAVLAVLGHDLTVEVVEDRLTLTATDGTGLSYRAESAGS